MHKSDDMTIYKERYLSLIIYKAPDYTKTN